MPATVYSELRRLGMDDAVADEMSQSVARTKNVVTNEHLDLRLAQFETRFAQFEAKFDLRFTQFETKLFELEGRLLKQQLTLVVSLTGIYAAIVAMIITIALALLRR